MYQKRRSFFQNKKCHYCGKPGTTFRLIKDRREILCDQYDCDKKSRIRAGWFGINIKI